MPIELETAEIQIDTIGVQAAIDAVSALTNGMGTFEATKEIPEPPPKTITRERPATPVESTTAETPDWRTDTTPAKPRPSAAIAESLLSFQSAVAPVAFPPLGPAPPIDAPMEERVAHAKQFMQQQHDARPEEPAPDRIAQGTKTRMSIGNDQPPHEQHSSFSELATLQSRTNELLARILAAVERPHPAHHRPIY